MGCQESCQNKNQHLRETEDNLSLNSGGDDRKHSTPLKVLQKNNRNSQYAISRRYKLSTDSSQQVIGKRNYSEINGRLIVSHDLLEQMKNKKGSNFLFCCNRNEVITHNSKLEESSYISKKDDVSSSEDQDSSHPRDESAQEQLVQYDTIQKSDDRQRIQVKFEESKLSLVPSNNKLNHNGTNNQVKIQRETNEEVKYAANKITNTMTFQNVDISNQNQSSLQRQIQNQSYNLQSNIGNSSFNQNASQNHQINHLRMSPFAVRKSSTSPQFISELPLFGKLQSKLNLNELNPLLGKSNPVGQSGSSSNNQAEREKQQFMMTSQQKSKEDRRQSVKIEVNRKDRDYSEEIKKEKSGRIIIDVDVNANLEAVQNLLKQLTNRASQKDKTSSDASGSIPAPNHASQSQNKSTNRNGGTAIEIKQQEVTKIQEYYYSNQDGRSDDSDASPIMHKKPKDEVKKEQQNQESKSQDSIFEKTPKRKHKASDEGHQRKKQKKSKKKVIQTTKTTQFLIHAIPVDEQNEIKDKFSKSALDNSQERSAHNLEENKMNDLMSDTENLTLHKIKSTKARNNKSKSPRIKDKKNKKKPKGGLTKTELVEISSQHLVQIGGEISIQNHPATEDDHLKKFENKWKQRKLDNKIFNKKDFHSTIVLRKQFSNNELNKDKINDYQQNALSNSIILQRGKSGLIVGGQKDPLVHSKSSNRRGVSAMSSKSHRRMSLGKDLFVVPVRGRIEQKYDLLEIIGQGGFGLVRKVRHKITGEIRAMKVLQLDSYDPVTLKNISNEVEILKMLDHPNIVKLYEFYEDKKNLYLIQEYIGGGDLFEKIKNTKGGFEENIAALVMKQVLSAILYCHQKGIVHRDLKPENILMEDPNNFNSIKIIDFGTSRNFQNSKNQNQKMNQKFGTVIHSLLNYLQAYYIAPEVLRKNYDEKCDIWSCGIILHILLCGYPPFRGKNEREILEKVEIGYFSLNGPEWKSVSREAKILLKQMLTYVPKDRINAEQALNHTWIQIQTKTEMVTFKEAIEALYALRNFHMEIKLQQAACLYIASQILSRLEIMKFKEIFNCFDLNGDGIIQQDELKELLIQHLGLTKDRAHQEAKRILSNIDINQNGAVDFTEFVIANVSTKDILTDDKLLNAFNMLDMDGNGRITKSDLAEVFQNSSKINDQILQEMIEEADEKGSGEIAFNEFKNLMLSLQNKPAFGENISGMIESFSQQNKM